MVACNCLCIVGLRSVHSRDQHVAVENYSVVRLAHLLEHYAKYTAFVKLMIDLFLSAHAQLKALEVIVYLSAFFALHIYLYLCLKV